VLVSVVACGGLAMLIRVGVLTASTDGGQQGTLPCLDGGSSCSHGRPSMTVDEGKAISGVMIAIIVVLGKF